MRVRPYTESDLAAIEAMHARQGFDYAFPDLSNLTFVSKLVLEVEDGAEAGTRDPGEVGIENSDKPASRRISADGQGSISESRATDHQSRATNGAGNCPPRIVMASLARLTCEIYLLVDPDAGSPRERYARLLALHAAAERDLYARGLDDVHAWLPPPIATRFGRRLTRLGWVRDDAWTPYSKRLEHDS